MPKLSIISGARCIKCSKPVEAEGMLCSDCADRQFSYTRGYALWSYNSYTKKLISEFKYKGRRDYTEFLVSKLTYHISGMLKSWNPDVIVPVPLHRSRYRQRGFNQAEIIADGVSRKTGIRLMNDVVIRNKKTSPQKKLDDRQRIKNVNDAFALNDDNISKYGNIKTALIIDDIYTTGSTIDACASLLKSRGIESFFATLCIGEGF